MNWDDFVEIIDGMLEDPKYSFASIALSGIKKTVSRTHEITEAQERAVDNIRRSKQEDDMKSGPSWKRRYEGMG